jgi:hypothetical protein
MMKDYDNPMTLAELLKSVGWPEFKASLLWSYPDEKESLERYRLVLARLRGLAPEASEMRIVLTEVLREGVDDEPHVDVSGREPYSAVDYSLSLEPWERWLGMRIDPVTQAEFTAPQIAAHCLWDMTFHGFDESQIRETKEGLMRQVEEIDAMSEEERKRRLIPMDDFMNDLPGNDGGVQ